MLLLTPVIAQRMRCVAKRGMVVDNRMLLDPNEIDDALAVVETAGRDIYLKFSYVNAVGPAPVNTSIRIPIEGPTASENDVERLIAAVALKGKEEGGWILDGSEPWLLSRLNFESFTKRLKSG
jgi:hypothetical protein